jgi:hypothetical protein
MKKWIVIQIAAVAILAIFGQVCKFNFPDNGLSAMNLQKDMLNGRIGVEYVMDEGLYNSLVNYPDQYDNLRADAAVVVIASPTGRIFQEGEIFGQEIEVIKTLKGAKQIKDDGFHDRFYVFGADGFRVCDDGRVKYQGGYGLMQQTSEYLIFLERIKYDALFPVKGYGLLGGFFGYIKLDNDDVGSSPIAVPIQDLLYDDVWQYEYIAESQKILDRVYLMKDHILETMAEELSGT